MLAVLLASGHAHAEYVRSEDSRKADASAGTRIVYKTLKAELYGDKDPYSLLDAAHGDYNPDHAYPMSNLKPELVARVLKHTGGPKFWLEVGSFIGNSAITTAREIKKAGLATSIIAVDPFSGDVNMWAWNKGLTGPNGFNYLEMTDDGAPRIYETFLANVKAQGHDDVILPVRATSLVGMRLLKRLRDETRLDQLPSVIYLDSAHEEDETFMELQNAWDTLRDGGVLFGDDWGWPAVHNDVTKFAQSLKLEPIPMTVLKSFDISTFNGFHAAEQPVPGVVLVDYQWLILKPKKVDLPEM